LDRIRSGQTPTPDDLDELGAWSRLLKLHIQRQQQDPGSFPDDTYQYNRQTKKLERWRNCVVKAQI